MSDLLPRSPLLLFRERSALLVVDVQQRLLPVVADSKRLVRNLERLARGAEILGIPLLATEQYPQGLGATADELRPFLKQIPDKLSFSCGGCAEFVSQLKALSATQIVVCGIETHVCVLQSVFDLIAAGFDVFVVADGVSSRHQIDHVTALRRMELSGATLVTVEAALFEWCVISGTDEFRQISRLVRDAESQFEQGGK